LVILEKRVPGLSQNSLARFVLRARRAAGLRGHVNVLVTGGAAVRALNRQFRGINRTTDVLSFPADPSVVGARATGRRNQSEPAGDVAISADIAVQNAFRLRHSAAQEVRVLVLHGILHLAGFDHERDNGTMARTEAKLRRDLGLPTSLIERVQSIVKAKPRRNRSTPKRRTA
jgi:probable rRNA maturation factor